MNKIILRGVIRNIDYSHTINDVEYEKADLIVPRKNKEDDIISLRFKKLSNIYKEDDKIEIVGNLRSYSQQLGDGRNKVQIYVFTYMDIPEYEEDTVIDNKCIIDGRICKIDEPRFTRNGKINLHGILANNIISNNNQKLNNYIPIVMWGNLAKEYANLKVNDKVVCEGQLHSRLYTKKLDNEEVEFRTAHELVVTNIKKVDELIDEYEI